MSNGSVSRLHRLPCAFLGGRAGPGRAVPCLAVPCRFGRAVLCRAVPCRAVPLHTLHTLHTLHKLHRLQVASLHEPSGGHRRRARPPVFQEFGNLPRGRKKKKQRWWREALPSPEGGRMASRRNFGSKCIMHLDFFVFLFLQGCTGLKSEQRVECLSGH